MKDFTRKSSRPTMYRRYLPIKLRPDASVRAPLPAGWYVWSSRTRSVARFEPYRTKTECWRACEQLEAANTPERSSSPA